VRAAFFLSVTAVTGSLSKKGGASHRAAFFVFERRIISVVAKPIILTQNPAPLPTLNE